MCISSYQPMLKYAWMKSGYAERVEGYQFKNVNQINFHDLKDCSVCKQISFIKCSHCSKDFCFKHLILVDDFHCHNVYSVAQKYGHFM